MEKELKRFLEKFNLPTSQIDTILEKWKENKKPLIDMIGFSDDCRLEVGKSAVWENSCTEYRSSVLIIKEFLDFMGFEIEREAIVKNDKTEHNNGLKVSKLIARLNRDGFFDEWLRHDQAIADSFAELGFNTSRKEEDNYIKAFIPTFFQMAKPEQAIIEISINPVDILGCNENASYNSCLRPTDGEYYNTTCSYLIDEFTVVATRYNKDRKRLGRAWVYVFENFMVMAKSYGTFSQTDRKAVREFIQNKINNTGDWSRKSAESVEYNRPSNIYIDSFENADLAYYKPANHYEFSIEFSEPVCLDCGERHSEKTSDGLCEECRDFKCCYCCGHRIDRVDAYRDCNDNFVCEGCFTEYYFECKECGEIYHNDDGRYIESVDGFVCDTCVSEEFETCHCCDNYFKSDEIVAAYKDGSPVRVCGDCLGDYILCESCDEYHYNDDCSEVDGAWYCPDCLEEKFEKCEECGGWTEKDELINGFCSSSCAGKAILAEAS